MATILQTPEGCCNDGGRKFFTNAVERTSGYTMFVWGKQVKYYTATINQLLHLPYNPSGPDEVDYLMNSTNIEEVINTICKVGVLGGP